MMLLNKMLAFTTIRTGGTVVKRRVFFCPELKKIRTRNNSRWFCVTFNLCEELINNEEFKEQLNIDLFLSKNVLVLQACHKVNIMPQVCNRKKLAANAFWEEIDEKYFQDVPSLLLKAFKSNITEQIPTLYDIDVREKQKDANLVKNEKYQVDYQATVTLTPHNIKSSYVMSPWENKIFEKFLKEFVSKNTDFRTFEKELERFSMENHRGEYENQRNISENCNFSNNQEMFQKHKPVTHDQYKSVGDSLDTSLKRNGPTMEPLLTNRDMSRGVSKKPCFTRVVYSFSPWGFQRSNYTEDIKHVLKNIKDWKCLVEKFLVCYIKLLDKEKKKNSDSKESHIGVEPINIIYSLGLIQSVIGPMKVGTVDSLTTETWNQYAFPHWFTCKLQKYAGNQSGQAEEVEQISSNNSCFKKEIQKLTVELDGIIHRKSIMLQRIVNLIKETKKPCKTYWNAVESALLDLYRYEVFHSVTPGYYAYSLSKQYCDLNYFRILSALNGLGISGWWTEQGLCSVCGSGVTYDEDPLVFCDACFIPAHHGCVGYPVVSVCVEDLPIKRNQDSFKHGSKMYLPWAKDQNDIHLTVKTNASKEVLCGMEGEDWFCDACHIVIQQVSNVPLALVIIRHLAGPRTPYDFQELLNYQGCNKLPQQFTLKLPCIIDDEARPLVKFSITDSACQICFPKTPPTEYLSSVGSKPDVNKTTCQTNIPVEYTLHQKKGIRGGVYVKEKKHSLTGMHSAAVGEWRRWLVQVTQEEVTKTAEMLRKKVKEKNSRAKDSWIGMNSTSRKSYGRWCVAGSSCTPCDEITKIVCLPVCSLCGYDPYFRGGGVIKKVDSKEKKSEFCHIRCALAAHGILSRESVYYNSSRLRSTTPCNSCGERGPDVVGCSSPGCLVSYHMSCGTQMRQCSLDFIHNRPVLYCETHSKDHLPSQSLRRYEACRQRKKSQWVKKKNQRNSSFSMTFVSASLYSFVMKNLRDHFVNVLDVKDILSILTTSTSFHSGKILDETVWILLNLYKGKRKKAFYTSLYLKSVGIQWNDTLLSCCLRLYYYMTGEFPTQQHELHSLLKIVNQCMIEPKFEINRPTTIGLQGQETCLCSSCCSEKTSSQTRLSLVTCSLCKMSVCMECLKGTTLHASSTFCCKVTSDSFVCLRCEKKKDAVCELCYRHDGYLILLQSTLTWVHSLCYQWFCKKSQNGRGTHLLRDCTNILQNKNICLFCLNPFGSTWVCDYEACSNAFHISCCCLWGCTMRIRKTGETLLYNAYCPDHSYNKDKSDWYCHIKRKQQSWNGCVDTFADDQFPLHFIRGFMLSIHIPKLLDWNETMVLFESYTLPYKVLLRKANELTEEGNIEGQREKGQKCVSSIDPNAVTNQALVSLKRKKKRKLKGLNQSSTESSDDGFLNGFFSQTQWTKMLHKVKRALKRSSTGDVDHVEEESQCINDMNKKKNLNLGSVALSRVRKKVKYNSAAIEHQPKRRGRPRKVLIEQEECAKTQVQLTTDATSDVTNDHKLKESKRRRPLISHSTYTPFLENFSASCYSLNKECVEPCSFTALPMMPLRKSTTCSPYSLPFFYPYYHPYQMTPFLTNICTPSHTTNDPFYQYADPSFMTPSFYSMLNSTNTFPYNQHYLPSYTALPNDIGVNQGRLPTPILPRQGVEQQEHQRTQDESNQGVLKSQENLTSRSVE